MATARRKRRPIWCGLGVIGLLMGAIAAAGQPPAAGPALPQTPTQYSPPATRPAATVEPHNLAAQLVADARASFARVKDYTATFIRQERVRGQLLPEQHIALRVRQQPLSIHMKWTAPKNLAGQEASFVTGQNNNQLRAKSAKPLLGAIGFVSLDPRDPKAMDNNRHPITEGGLGNLIEQIGQAHEQEKRLAPNQLQLQFGNFLFNQRVCTRMEATHLVNNGQFYCYRCAVYFDRETRLPVRFEAYDWPQPGGPPGGEVLEIYNYIDLKFNVGLSDAAFNY